MAGKSDGLAHFSDTAGVGSEVVEDVLSFPSKARKYVHSAGALLWAHTFPVFSCSEAVIFQKFFWCLCCCFFVCFVFMIFLETSDIESVHGGLFDLYTAISGLLAFSVSIPDWMKQEVSKRTQNHVGLCP